MNARFLEGPSKKRFREEGWVNHKSPVFANNFVRFITYYTNFKIAKDLH